MTGCPPGAQTALMLKPLTPVALAADVDELLAGATSRTPIADGAGKSGAVLERVVIDGNPFVLKRIDLADDWIMRSAGQLRGSPCELWVRGVYDQLPDCMNQPIVGVAVDPGTGVAPSGGCVLLMHDVSPWLVPSSDEPVPLEQHLRFIAHMARLHATFWGCGTEYDVVPMMHRFIELSPLTAVVEAELGGTNPVPPLIGKGWAMLPDVAPAAARVVLPLAHDPGPLVTAMQSTPQTFVHGDWKLDNLGTDDTGRTILLDWAMPGRCPALSELAWYLAINCRRLPQSHDDTIEAYRNELEHCGIDTAPWWDRQLGLCLIGGLVLFGWDKALGGYDEELAWWEQKVVAAAPLLA
jgi:Phosphotransferase enzyme family